MDSELMRVGNRCENRDSSTEENSLIDLEENSLIDLEEK